MPILVDPLISFDCIDLAELNRCLIEWDHKMGPWERPNFGSQSFHGLRHNGELVAVTAAARLIGEQTAGLSREQAFELGRVCAIRPHLCRPVLRLWREFAFPAICRAHSWTWAISYQDADLHTGNLYRFDGWLKLGTSSSGTDQRSGKRGRKKIIWGWCDDVQRALAKSAS
jgi:antitoxin VapB